MTGVGRALSSALVGITPYPVEVTAEAGGNGLQFAGVLGCFPEARARECSVRVRSALAQVGIASDALVTIESAAPVGAAVDLAIALAVAVAVGSAPAELLESGHVLLGELSLSGDVRPVRGALPVLGGHVPGGPIPPAVVPFRCAEELALLPFPARQRVRIPDHLREVLDWARGVRPSCSSLSDIFPRFWRHGEKDGPPEPDPVPRALLAPLRASLAHLEAGRGVLLVGPPGSGKTLLARRLARLLGPLGAPPASADLLVAAAVHSAAGISRPARGAAERPFRAPHHTCSEAGLVGGGDPARPGEVSLAHGGVLFLDEVLEFRRTALGAVAAARRDGLVRLRRGGRDAVFPAGCAIVAATNPCPCGWFTNYPAGGRACACSPEAVARWVLRLGEVRKVFGLEVVEVPALDGAGMRDAVDVSRGLPREEG